MFGKKKHKTQVLSVITSVLLVFTSCTEEKGSLAFKTISGETQGTTYSIIIVDDHVDVTKDVFDSLFHSFDMSLSTYIDSSVISLMNNSPDSIRINDPSGFFKRCYLESRAIYNETKGDFDPSVFPLIKAWGFMDNLETPLDQSKVDSVLNFVSFEEDLLHHIQFTNDSITLLKNNASFKLDFNAIAQGLSVDVVAELLNQKGYENYYIEIGGELIVKGHNKEGQKWRIGIDSPKDNLESRELNTVLSITDKAIATSGNYRKFYVVNGVKYAHTLNPKTGFPVQHSLLSATVVADNTTDADGYATAFMVMGLENTLSFIKSHKELNLDVYLLYANEKGEIESKTSKDFSTYIMD